MRMDRIVILLVTTMWLGGCGMLDLFEGPDNFDPTISVEIDPNQQIATLEADIQQLHQQIATLNHIPEALRNTPLYVIKQVLLGKYTGFYDKDENGTQESLIVYIKPIDDDGDIIKAIGQVQVELWDLNQGPEEARLGHWNFEPQELKQHWFSGLGQLNYRLVFEVAEVVQGRTGPFTVKMTFTDLVYGRVFDDQVAVSKDKIL